jgi:hypothetical protein
MMRNVCRFMRSSLLIFHIAHPTTLVTAKMCCFTHDCYLLLRILRIRAYARPERNAENSGLQPGLALRILQAMYSAFLGAKAKP